MQDEIAQIEHLVEEIHALLAQFIRTYEQLDLASAVFNMRKRDLAHRASRANTPRQCGFDFHTGSFLGFKFCDRFSTEMCALRTRRIGFDPFRAQLFQFL